MQNSTSSISLAKRLNWVNLLFLTLTMAVALIGTPIYLHYNGWSWSLFALFAVLMMFTEISITGGYHRYLAHRSYECKPVLKLFYLIFGAGAFQGSALQWAADHRRHHRFVDTDRDPHNINKGFWWAHIGWLVVKEDPKNASPFPPDLTRDPLIMWQHRHFVLIAAIVSGVVPTLIGLSIGHPFGGFLFGGVIRVVVSNHITFFINSLAHCVGTKPYNTEQTARDSLLMAFLAAGEGYHNYHHQFASDYRNGIRWYHWDPTKWFIKAMSVPGWTYRLKRIPATEILKARLRVEQSRLVAYGHPIDRVQAIRQRVEEAQKRWRALREEYSRRKQIMQDRSHQHVLQLKAELRAARADFKRAWAQWASYRKRAGAISLA